MAKRVNHPKVPVEIVLLEDDPRLRELLSVILDGSPGFFCRRSYANAASLLAELDRIGAAILLMDIDLGKGMNGIQAAAKVRESRPDLTVIMLTVHEDDDSVFSALCAGAVGYLIKGLPPVRLVSALEDAAAGGAPMSPRIARRVVATFHTKAGPANPLTKREKEVLRLLCDGDSYREVGAQLFISGHTVRSHIKHIYEKLQVHSRAEAVKKALEDRLLRF